MYFVFGVVSFSRVKFTTSGDVVVVFESEVRAVFVIKTLVDIDDEANAVDNFDNVEVGREDIVVDKSDDDDVEVGSEYTVEGNSENVDSGKEDTVVDDLYNVDMFSLEVDFDKGGGFVVEFNSNEVEVKTLLDDSDKVDVNVVEGDFDEVDI